MENWQRNLSFCAYNFDNVFIIVCQFLPFRSWDPLIILLTWRWYLCVFTSENNSHKCIVLYFEASDSIVYIYEESMSEAREQSKAMRLCMYMYPGCVSWVTRCG